MAAPACGERDAQRHEVSEQTLYVWRKRFGAMSVDEAKRLKALEAENARLKKGGRDRMEVTGSPTGWKSSAEAGRPAEPNQRTSTREQMGSRLRGRVRCRKNAP